MQGIEEENARLKKLEARGEFAERQKMNVAAEDSVSFQTGYSRSAVVFCCSGREVYEHIYDIRVVIFSKCSSKLLSY